MTVFAGVKLNKNHFDSYIQWFEFIEDSTMVNQETKVNVYNRKVLPVSDR